MTATDTDSTSPVLPVCRICGHEDHYLGDHLSEAHGLSVEEYLAAFPGSPTVSDEALAAFDADREKNVRRSGPPADTDLRVDVGAFPVKVNPDVPAAACLPCPSHYRLPEHGELGVDVQEASISALMGRHMFIWGEPGTGKDAYFHWLSATLRRPALMKQVQPGSDIQAWFFSRSFDRDGTSWEEGELLKALRDGYTCPETGRKVPYLILITDFDRATKSQAETMRLVLDSISGRVEGPGGKVYNVFPGTQIVVTANTAGGGDARGRMVSANVIDASILDRFERKFQFHWMEWADEGPIVQSKFPMLVEQAPDVFAQVGKATAALRDAIVKEQLYAEFSHRAVCAWLGHMQDIVALTGTVPKDLVKRGARAVLDGMPDDETRLAAERLIDPHIRGGVVGTGRDVGRQSGNLGDFK